MLVFSFISVLFVFGGALTLFHRVKSAQVLNSLKRIKKSHFTPIRFCFFSVFFSNTKNPTIFLHLGNHKPNSFLFPGGVEI